MSKKMIFLSVWLSVLCGSCAFWPAPATQPSLQPAAAPLATAAAPTAIAQVAVLNAADGTVAGTLAPGGTLYLSQLPASLTLQVSFTARIGKALFWLDNLPEVQQWSAPYAVGNKNPCHPLPLTVGSHKLVWAVDSQPQQTFSFSVASVPPLPGVSAAFGENLAGISYPEGDSVLHPQLLTAAHDLQLKAVRAWLEGSWAAVPPASYFKITRQWTAQGLSVYAVANFQNSLPRCTAPSDSVWAAYWTSFPPPALTGISVIQIGNEVNTSGYWKGSPAQLAHLMQVAWPILHAKGYAVEAGSDLNETAYTQKLLALGAAAWCDRLDVHAYYASAAQLAAMVDSGIALGRTVGKPCDVSELGVRMSPANLPAWAAEEARALTLLRARNGGSVFIPFSFYPIEPLDAADPLDSSYDPGEPFWSSAFLPVLGARPATQPFAQPATQPLPRQETP